MAKNKVAIRRRLTLTAVVGRLTNNSRKKVNGTLITIWHNHMIGNAKPFEGWREMYEKALKAIVENG